jgi:predicted enzyme related to lactoylglutathione lyase
LYPSVVIAFDDIKEAMQRVKEEGGIIMGKPMEIQCIGKYVSF